VRRTGRPGKSLEEHDLAASFNQYLLLFLYNPEFLTFVPCALRFSFLTYAYKMDRIVNVMK